MGIKVYTASKTRHAVMWKQIRDIHDDLTFTARWVNHTLEKRPETPQNAIIFWVEDEDDVRDADVVLVFADPTDVLRGALVEAGMGIALGKRIIVVGEHESYGTWQYHPLVHRVRDLKGAFTLLNYWNRNAK